MANAGKRIRAARETVDRNKQYDLSEAVKDVNDAFFGWDRFIINVRVALLIAAAINNVFGNLG